MIILRQNDIMTNENRGWSELRMTRITRMQTVKSTINGLVRKMNEILYRCETIYYIMMS